MLEPLDIDTVKRALEKLPEWRLQDNTLHRQFEFSDFNQAFSFMTAVALLAEKADHHPDWSNIYNRVDISLTTHDAKGITNRDLELATAIDKLC